ncbi:MAG: methylated-DNA--[protein]-cysteine S-methyltransferase [Spirochaetia bacterium]|nr:methylated-DNA--[protein]-cysteine S-methyltransferase [Spirochaetia bacterium]
MKDILYTKNKIHPAAFFEIKTPIGFMTAGAIEKGISLLQFKDEPLELKTTPPNIKENNKKIIEKYFLMLKTQLDEFFNKKRRTFDLPLVLSGTLFQQKAWQTLLNIPYGKTISYEEEARQMKNKKAVRAAANANAANKIAIIVPCHRVISKNGALAGYSAGIERKKYLLDLEQH